MINTPKDIATLDDLISFGDAVEEIAYELIDLELKGYENLLIPSRGAYPFYLHAYKYFEATSNPYQPTFNTLILPFSSDNFENHEGRAETVREYWVDTYNSILNGQKNANQKFYSFLAHKFTALQRKNTIMSDIFDRVEDASDIIPSHRPADDKRFIFIDTVISGRATDTILRAMDKRGMQYHAILIADQNGQRLKPKYKSYLKQKEAQGKVKFINIDNLFTEDKGPGLLGMGTLVFPSLIHAAAGIDEFGLEHPGAALTLRIPYTTKYNDCIVLEDLYKNRFNAHEEAGYFYASNAMEHAIRYTLAKQGMGGGNKRKLKPQIQNFLETMHTPTERFKLTSKENTEQIYSSMFQTMGINEHSLRATSSHIIEVNFSDKYSKQLIDEFKTRLHKSK